MAAAKGMENLVVLVVTMILAASSLWSQAMAQSNCQVTLASLGPCLAFTTSNGSAPSPQCCDQFRKVVQAQPQCLCQVLNNNNGINKTCALELPNACDVNTPPPPNCNFPPGSGRPAGPQAAVPPPTLGPGPASLSTG